jgi:hypothetical protein
MTSPQELSEDLIELSKDKPRLISGITLMNEQQRKAVKSVITFIKDNTIPTSKKPKVTKSSRPLNEDIINDLKGNIKKNLKRGLIEYKQIEVEEFARINNLDLEQNKDVFKSFRSRILNDRSALNILSLYQDYCEGWLYETIRNKCETDYDFFQYCRKVFKITENTIDTYLSFYYLVLDFPSILLSNLPVTKINRYSNLIKKTVETDNELKELLEKPFCGIEGNFKIHKLDCNEN